MDCTVTEQVSALGVNVIFLSISNIDDSFFTNSLKNEIEHYYKTFTDSCSFEEIANESSIKGYQLLHEKVGAADKSLVASPESLMKILFKHKTLRSINPIVDAYNYIAIKNRVSIGAHDMEQIEGNVDLRLSEGDECFIPLGKNKPQPINAGEYCYIDDANEVICRLDCRQCDKTKTSANTKSCLFIIQGNEFIPSTLLNSTADELLDIFNLGISNTVQHSITLA